jgi:hypothetical protein
MMNAFARNHADKGRGSIIFSAGTGVVHDFYRGHAESRLRGFWRRRSLPPQSLANARFRAARFHGRAEFFQDTLPRSTALSNRRWN